MRPDSQQRKNAGLNSKILRGHAGESTHLRYLPKKEPPVAKPLRIRKSWTTLGS
jgi:hypothetical protein